MRRNSEGFGFSVVGYNPVCVARVTPGSPAAAAGLKKGDAIIAINGQNVRKATADAVANIVL